jgi:hypothetical protein
MAHALLIALALVCYFGFVLLALSQDRHWERAGGSRDCPARLVLPMRIAGYAFLLCSLALALWRDGPSFGSLVWATMLSVAAVAVTCTLTWRANWLRPIVRTLQGIA